MNISFIFTGLSATDIARSVLAGVISGAVMALVSHILYRFGIFRSSLVLIDGWFFMGSVKIKGPGSLACLFGIPIHLITSGVFGGAYIILANLFRLDIVAPLSVSTYSSVLWIAMLFIALPAAGQGIMGKKLHPLTWLEQLFLHMVFGMGLFAAMKILF